MVKSELHPPRLTMHPNALGGGTEGQPATVNRLNSPQTAPCYPYMHGGALLHFPPLCH